MFYYRFMKRKVNDWEILSERKKLLKKVTWFLFSHKSSNTWYY
jgi:hypothetical protein